MQTTPVETRKWIHPGTGQVRYYVYEWKRLVGIDYEKSRAGNVKWMTIQGESVYTYRHGQRDMLNMKLWFDEAGALHIDHITDNIEDSYIEKIRGIVLGEVKERGLDFMPPADPDDVLPATEEDLKPTVEVGDTTVNADIDADAGIDDEAQALPSEFMVELYECPIHDGLASGWALKLSEENKNLEKSQALKKEFEYYLENEMEGQVLPKGSKKQDIGFSQVYIFTAWIKRAYLHQYTTTL